MNDAPPKVKFPRADALVVAKLLCDSLRPVTERLICAGSLRRGKAMVGDVEILYIPRREPLKQVREGEMFEAFAPRTTMTNLADLALAGLLARGVIEKRHNSLGSEMWGDKNKLARHVASGIPVDLFSATRDNWFNYLVCRTGSAEHNLAICNAAIEKGWKWNPYGEGFTDAEGNSVPVLEERDVFRLVGLSWREPKDR